MYQNPLFFQQLTKTRQHLHKHPELSNQEVETTAYIRHFLEEQNIRILETSLKTGLIAEIGVSDKKQIGLRADIDALPIIEATNLPYASVNSGVMHACGHDFHTASLLGAATLLKQQEAQLPGKVYLVFQPAEEIFQGARQVLQAVNFEELSGLVGFHNAPELPLGTIGTRASEQMASVDRFQLTIHGIGSHAAHPEQGNDPIVTGAQIISNAQAIISRHVPASEQAVLSITHVNAGSTWNVIPEQFYLEGTIRTFNEEVRKKVVAQFKELAQHTAASFGQSLDIEWITGPGPVNNDPVLYPVLTESLTKTAKEVITLKRNLGGEDFAFYQEAVPTFFASIGTGAGIPLHHPGFLIDDSALLYSVNFYLKAVETLLDTSIAF